MTRRTAALGRPQSAPGASGRVRRFRSWLGHVPVTALCLGGLACGGTSPLPPPEALELRDVSVDTLEVGAEITLTGRGFGETADFVQVRIGGEVARVTNAASRTLTVIVPELCRPTGPVEVRVAVGGTADSLQRPLRAPAARPAAVGELVLLGASASRCLVLDAQAGEARWLFGVLNATESPGDLQQVVIQARTGATGLALESADDGGPMVAGHRETTRATSVPSTAPAWSGDAASPGLGRRAEAEARLRRLDRSATQGRSTPAALRRQLGAPGALAPAARAQAVLAVPATVGDSVSVRFSAGGCAVSSTLRTVVRAAGRRSVWLEDVANPAGGFLPADYAALVAAFDERIFPVDSATWGAPTDLDGNGRVAIVVSQQVNRLGLLGFATSADFLAPTGPDACPRSNVGEYLYLQAPDPGNSTGGGVVDRARGLREAPVLLAHELTHVIQFGRRLGAAQRPLEFWESEGQATLAEQLNGFATDGLPADAEAGLGVAFRNFDPARTAWYADLFGDLSAFQGANCEARAPDGSCSVAQRVPGAPAACSPLASFLFLGYQDMGAPCTGRRAAYGVPALLLGFAADRYGRGPGGPQAFLRDLVGSGAVGLANLSARAGVPADQLLAEFYAALALDGQGITGAPGLRAWNLQDIFFGEVRASDGTLRRLVPQARLQPRVEPAWAFTTDPLAVRGGSSAFVLVGGSSGRPQTAIELRRSGGGSLGSGIRLWGVRLR